MHVVLDVSVGLGWLLEAPHRTSGAAFAPARSLLAFTPFYPMRAWGLLLLALTIPLILGVALGREWLYTVGRILLAGNWVFWAGIIGLSYFDGEISPLGPTMSVLWAIRTVRLPTLSPWRREPRIV